MSLYRRGDVWWYKFWFNGQLIRESSKSESKTLAKDARARGAANWSKPTTAFRSASVCLGSPTLRLCGWRARWGSQKRAGNVTSNARRISRKNSAKGLVCDVDANDIAEYGRKRLAAGVANRTANYETGTLRDILRQFGLWGPIADKVKALPERHDVGRAISQGDESKLLAAASVSRSPALLPSLCSRLILGCPWESRKPSVAAIFVWNGRPVLSRGAHW
jgi:hypothetical protein